MSCVKATLLNYQWEGPEYNVVPINAAFFIGYG